jgi:tape measure domain-containing protein
VSVVANVAINVDSSAAAQKLREFKNKSQQAEKAASKIGPATQQSFDAASASANRLTATVGKLAAAYLTLQTAQRAVQAGIKRIESERRLEILAKGFNEVAEAQAVAARAAKTFGISQTQANTEFARAFVRLRPLGVALKDIESAYIGFETAAKLSGASADEASSAWLQLTQALGSGTLRGQELNSVLTQTPIVVQAIAREMGIGTEKIKELAAQGQITSDIVIRALRRIETEGADQLKEALGGPAAAVQELQVAFEDLQVAATRDLIPAIIGIVKELKNVLEGLAPVIRGLGSLAAETLGTIGDLINAATKPGAAAAAVSIKSGRLPLGMSGAKELFKGTSGAGGAGLEGIVNEARQLSELRKQPFNQVILQLMQNRLQRVEAAATPQARAGAAMPTPSMEVTGGGGGGGGGGGRRAGGVDRSLRDADRAAESAARELARVENIIRNRLAEGDVIRLNSELQERIAAADSSRDLMLSIRLRGVQKELDIQQRYARELAQETDARAQQAIIYKGNVELVANQRETERILAAEQLKIEQERLNSMQKFIEQQYALNTAAQQQLDLTNSITDTLGRGMTSAFDSLIQGSENWGASLRKIASGVLIDIANQLLRIFVIEQAINAIKGVISSLSPFSAATPLGAGGGTVGRFGTLGPNFGIPQRAKGGPVSARSPYIVGERGPELFVPGRSGTIVANDKMGGSTINVVVNVDAKESSVEGDEQGANQLGRIISAAVQSELIKQQRPGGVLAR